MSDQMVKDFREILKKRILKLTEDQNKLKGESRDEAMNRKWETIAILATFNDVFTVRE